MNRNVLVRIDTPDPARLWTGSGPLYIPADAIEPQDGALYLGGGELVDGLGDIEQLINGTAARIDITVSGVSAETMALWLQEKGSTQGARCDIGVVEFDDLWQIVAVTWVQQYTIDKPGLSRGDGTRTITLSMGTDDTGRSRSLFSYWTPADQARRSADDRIFDQVPLINASKSRTFGPSG